MAGTYADLTSFMDDPNMSISRSPFNKTIVVLKRASFKKGETPAHLKAYALSAGMIPKGLTGTVIYKGKRIPKVAAWVAEHRAKAKAASVY